jgi:glycerol kinase
MAYGTAEVLQAQEADSGVAATELRVDGGAARNDWLMKFQAGVLGIPVRRAAVVETTALGAAGLAGLARGVWKSADDFLAAREAPAVFPPEMGAEERAGLLRGWDRAVSAARSWAVFGR